MKRTLGLYLLFFAIVGVMIFNAHACPTHLGVMDDESPPFFSDEAYDIGDMHAHNEGSFFDDVDDQDPLGDGA